MALELPGELKACPSCRRGEVEHLDFLYDKRALVAGHYVSFISGCRRCGLIFVNPPPPQHEIDAYYRPGGAWDKRVKRGPEGLPEAVKALEQQRADYRAMFVSEVEALESVRGSRILDFGCGNGEILDALQDKGWDTTGLEPTLTQPLSRHKTITVMPDGPTYDIVIMKHVLEHLSDPLATLRQARRCLVDSGKLIIGVPTLDNLSVHGKKRYCVNRFQHVAAWTRRSLTHMLGVAGFEVVKTMPSFLTQRTGLVAHASAPMTAFSDPLRDARRELRRYAAAQDGWLNVLIKPVRARAEAANHPVKKQQPSKPAAKMKQKKAAAPRGEKEEA